MSSKCVVIQRMKIVVARRVSCKCVERLGGHVSVVCGDGLSVLWWGG